MRFSQTQYRGPSLLILAILVILSGVVVAGCGSPPSPARDASGERTPEQGQSTAGEPENATDEREAEEHDTGEEGEGEGEGMMKLDSPVFQYGGTIPPQYTCKGKDLSPELQWRDAPAETKSFALIVDDPDAPGGTFTHWVLFDIPATLQSLPDGEERIGVSGKNSFGKTGYKGPCPPPGHGVHRYFFRLYALDVVSLPLQKGASRKDVEAAMQTHILEKTEYMGTFERK
jgi:hypothetical protein